MNGICATCEHDQFLYGCEYQCVGVTEYDEENETVTACEDYKQKGE